VNAWSGDPSEGPHLGVIITKSRRLADMQIKTVRKGIIRGKEDGQNGFCGGGTKGQQILVGGRLGTEEGPRDTKHFSSLGKEGSEANKEKLRSNVHQCQPWECWSGGDGENLALEK